MGLKRKQTLMRQKAYLEQKLQDRVSFMAKKEIKSLKPDRDTIVRKWKADIKALNKRLQWIADNDKKTEELAKMKADRAAAPKKKEQEAGKGEKAKKASAEGKAKKAKAGKPAEGGKAPKTGEAPAEGKKKKAEKTGEEPAAPAKAEK